jgi:hypothetical protein
MMPQRTTNGPAPRGQRRHRVRSWVWRLAVGISVLLFGTAIVLWTRSHASPVRYTLRDVDAMRRPYSRWTIGWSQGGWGVMVQDRRPDVPVKAAASPGGGARVESDAGWHVEWLGDAPYPALGQASSAANRLGFYHSYRRDGTYAYALTIVAPFWSLALVFGVLPTWALAGALRRRLRKPRRGHCDGCGYDLRASPDRCPECGEVVAASWGEKEGHHALSRPSSDASGS